MLIRCFVLNGSKLSVLSISESESLLTQINNKNMTRWWWWFSSKNSHKRVKAMEWEKQHKEKINFTICNQKVWMNINIYSRRCFIKRLTIKWKFDPFTRDSWHSLFYEHENTVSCRLICFSQQFSKAAFDCQQKSYWVKTIQQFFFISTQLLETLLTDN